MLLDIVNRHLHECIPDADARSTDIAVPIGGSNRGTAR